MTEKLPIAIERRAEILSKDFISLRNFTELVGLPYPTAQKLMAKIKWNSEREAPKGYIHIQDYLDHFHLPSDRYFGFEQAKTEII